MKNPDGKPTPKATHNPEPQSKSSTSPDEEDESIPPARPPVDYVAAIKEKVRARAEEMAGKNEFVNGRWLPTDPEARKEKLRKLQEATGG